MSSSLVFEPALRKECTEDIIKDICAVMNQYTISEKFMPILYRDVIDLIYSIVFWKSLILLEACAPLMSMLYLTL